MIGRANEVLNALLRLRKHQLASEQLRAANNVPEQYQVKSSASILKKLFFFFLLTLFLG